MKKLMTICMVVMMASATSANYDPALPAPAPVLDAGWASDQISAAFVDSADSPYVFTLTDAAYFRISDDFVVGDIYYVSDFGTPILTTTFFAGAPTGFSDPSGWLSAAYSKGEILLAAGAHSLTVQGDGAGGLPAGFWTRLTTAQVVPAPGAILLGGIGVSIVGWLRRRKIV